MTVYEGELLPARTAPRPIHKHAVCGYIWRRAQGLDGISPYRSAETLCGDYVDLPQPPEAIDACPRCRLMAAVHGQQCDCFKMWKAPTVPGTLAPRSLP